MSFVTGDKTARIVAMKACEALNNSGYDAEMCAPAEAVCKVRDDMLYLADDAETVKRLADASAKVCGFMHGTNKQERFPGLKYVFDDVDEVDSDSYRKAWERLAGCPWTIAKTDRLLIRETTIDDLEALYDIYSDPRITRYQDGLYEDREAEKQYMKDYIEKIYGLMGFGIWSLVRLDDNTLIGRAGLSAANGFDNIELGFTVGVPWQRQGYAYEACSQILRFAEWVLGVTRVYASVKHGNTASAGLCVKLGFERGEETHDGYIRYLWRADNGQIHNGS